MSWRYCDAMTTLVHISDLHFGDADEARLTRARQAINSIAPDCVVMTGDLTQSGHQREFDAARRWLKDINAPIVGCPGNHDAPVFNIPSRLTDPFGRFAALDLLQSWRSGDGYVALEAANSARGVQARLDWSQGDYGQANVIDALKRLGASNARLGILALHHPPETPLGARVKSDPVGLDAFNRYCDGPRPDIVMCGHVHDVFDFRAASIGGMRVITAPSLSSHRERGFGSGFVVLEIAAAISQVTRTVWHHQTNGFVQVEPVGVAQPHM
jgi:3',5'-cyclic AMP phosphodiesterase CpdA